MKADISGTMKRFSGAMIQPVMFLSVAGIMLALVAIFRMTFMPALIVGIGDFFYNLLMNGMIGNLSLIFCIGLTAALAKKLKTDAAIIGVISFLMFVYANNYWLGQMGAIVEADSLYGTGQAMVLGVQVVDMGVFAGIILGCLNAWLFNKFCDVQFPDAVRVYGGTRFVFFLSVLTSALFGIAMCYCWPPVSNGITALQYVIESSGYIGLFIYGFLNRILIPTGLHHLVYMPFCYTAVGGAADVAGQTYQGAAMIWMAEIGSSSSISAVDPSIKYLLFGFSKVFGSIGCVLAFIATAKPEKKTDTKALLLPAAMTAFIAGITEPLEFMYLFVSPLLFAVHSVLDGIFQVILFAVGYRATLSGGVTDLITTILCMPADLTHWYVVLPVGAIGVAVWYFLFKFLILKLDLKTPGREDDGEEIDMSKMNKQAYQESKQGAKAGVQGDVQYLIDGLGGGDNITGLMNCFTRLRIDLADISKIDEDTINKYPNKGIVKGKSSVQIIIGMKVQDVCEALAEKLGRTLE